MDGIESHFKLAEKGLYADDYNTVTSRPGGPAFMWACGVQLSALAAAAALKQPESADRLARYVFGLDIYWTNAFEVGGYDVLPAPKPSDRYYDDNEWVVLALLDAFEATGDKQYITRAESDYLFLASGEDGLLGGGLYWKEAERSSKNTCSNAPAIVAALRLARLTGKPRYRGDALRWYAWTNQYLRDADNLYSDNIKLDGKVDHTKYSYNSALMIRANCELYRIAKSPEYLVQAQTIAAACVARWVKPQTGAIEGDAAFSHLLSEAFLYLYEQDHDLQWPRVVGRALAYLHSSGHDAAGSYPSHWEDAPKAPIAKARLIDQAAAARAYLVAARFPAVEAILSAPQP